MQNTTVIYIIYAIPALLLAISLHETMHSVVGYWLGDDTSKSLGRISFNPIRHIDPLTTIALPLVMVALGQAPFAIAKPVPINTSRLKYDEFGMALVGVAGPSTNLLLGIVSVVLLKVISPALLAVLASGSFATSHNVLANFLAFSILMNFGLFVFNMIPFPPLDGSRVLYAFAPEFIQNVMEKIEQMGFTSIILFMVIAFPVISPAIGAINIALIRFFAG